MPIFEYTCQECGNEFEYLVLKPSEHNEIKCPKCHSASLEEKVSGFASLSTSGGSGSTSCTPGGG